jgi:hypothetical protein
MLAPGNDFVAREARTALTTLTGPPGEEKSRPGSLRRAVGEC